MNADRGLGLQWTPQRPPPEDRFSGSSAERGKRLRWHLVMSRPGHKDVELALAVQEDAMVRTCEALVGRNLTSREIELRKAVAHERGETYWWEPKRKGA